MEVFIPVTEFVKKGDKYSWWWHGYPDEVVEHGEILDCNGKRSFQIQVW
jgi:hypothetical protein